MPMSSRISSHRVFVDVRADSVCREVQQNTSRSLAPRVVIDQLKSWNIGDKIRIPRAMTFDYSAFATEVPFLATEAIGKSKELLKMKSTFRKRLIITGASVRATNLAGSSP